MKRSDRFPRECHCGAHAFATLTGGSVAFLDVEDLSLVTGICWSAGSPKNYARCGRLIQGKLKTIRMHRVITNAPDGMEVDHINGDSLDNRRANLRVCTREENQRNRGGMGLCKFKGVSYEHGRRSSHWRARIMVDGKAIGLGMHQTMERAAHAYDAAATEFHGKFACLNFNQETGGSHD